MVPRIFFISNDSMTQSVRHTLGAALIGGAQESSVMCSRQSGAREYRIFVLPVEQNVRSVIEI